MIFLRKIIVFNHLFQFPNSKNRRKKWHKLLRIKEINLFCEHKLSRIQAFQISKVINYRENGRNSWKPRNFLIGKVSAPKVIRSYSKLFHNYFWVLFGFKFEVNYYKAFENVFLNCIVFIYFVLKQILKMASNSLAVLLPVWYKFTLKPYLNPSKQFQAFRLLYGYYLLTTQVILRTIA